MSNPSQIQFPKPMIGFAAYSGTGKTTLLLKLLPLLKQTGLRIGMVKHAHHDIEMDYPGKDSYELRKAGADEMLITGDLIIVLQMNLLNKKMKWSMLPNE